MANRPPERHLAAWRSLLEVHKNVVELLARELEEQRGLPLGWYDVLLTLDQAPEQRLRMQELAQSVLLSKSGLTRLIAMILPANTASQRVAGRIGFAPERDIVHANLPHVLWSRTLP